MNSQDLVRELPKESSSSAENDMLLAFLQGGFFFLPFFNNVKKEANSNKTKSNQLQIYYWVEI